MAISVKNIAQDETECLVLFGSETAKITYRPMLLTNANMKAVEEAQRDGNLDEFFEFMCDLILRWDVLDDDGQMVALVPENLNNLPLFFVGKVFSSIMEDSDHLGDGPKFSKGGSRQKAKLESLPTGTKSFS